MIRVLLLALMVVFLSGEETFAQTSPPISGGGASLQGGGTGVPGGSQGSIQYRLGNNFAGAALGASFSISGGTLNLTPGAACFNLGAYTGVLAGSACAAPTFAPGAVAAGLGPVSGDLAGSWPNLSLVQGNIFTAMGTPGGDMGGTSYKTPLITGLNGIPIDTTIAPTPGTALTFNGAKYSPQSLAPGINQLSGAVSAGPGTGLQITTLNAGVVQNTNLVNQPPNTIKCNPVATLGPPQDCPVSGGLVFANNGLQLDPNLGVSTNQTFLSATGVSSCMTISRGVIVSVLAGACSTGATVLTADDGLTPLTADDGATQLTAEGGTTVIPCGALQYKFSVVCNAILAAL